MNATTAFVFDDVNICLKLAFVDDEIHSVLKLLVSYELNRTLHVTLITANAVISSENQSTIR